MGRAEQKRSHRQREEYNNASQGALFILASHGSDACCGCPCGCCCVGSAVKCEYNNTLPGELTGVITLENYAKMIMEINETLQDTLLPPCPCIFFHLCMPFSPECARIHYRGKRYAKIKEIIARYNTTMAGGYYWEVAPEMDDALGFAFLRLNGTGTVPVLTVVGSMDRQMASATAVQSPMKTEY